MKNIAIIGAGLSGLVSAWYIKEFHPEVKVTIFEADKTGGQISTHEFNNTLIESGPLFLLLENPVLHHIVSRIQPEGLIPCKDEKAYVLKDTYYQKAPGGFMEFENGMFSFFSGGFSSFFGLKKKASLWETVSFFDFLKSTYGLNYAETLGSAFARNIFFTEAENLNFSAAYPDLYRELKKGKNLKDTLASYGSETKSYWQKEINGTFTPGIYYYKGGLSKLISDITADIKTRGCQIEISKIYEIGGKQGEYFLHSRKNKYGAFDKIISTVSAPEQSNIWKVLHKELSLKLAELKHRSVSCIYSAYNPKDFNRAGLGFFAPRKEKLTISGAWYINSINQDIENSNQFITGTLIPGDLSLFSDQELIDIQINDFEKVFSLKTKPLWSQVIRRESAGPLLDNHYLPWKNSVADYLREMPDIALTGNDMASGEINQILDQAYHIAKSL